MITKTAITLNTKFGRNLLNKIPGLRRLQPEHARYVRRGLILSGALGGGTYLGDKQYKTEISTLEIPDTLENGGVNGNIA